MGKKISVAFIWHMHQPLYKDHLTGKYLMPWVRLHAIKDYLDMLLILKNFPEIKQTFNLVPSLIDQIIDYADNNAHDKHSELMIKDSSEFTEEEKVFILERFFDANYDNKIAPNKYYKSLFERSRSLNASANIHNFTNQEYDDIIVWFNLVWFDPMWYEELPELRALYIQNSNYTLQQKVQLLEIQRNIIRKIIPTYKEYQDNGQIEITTTPYYHPIMPLLIDTESAKRARPDMKLPERFQYQEDAKEQLIKAIKQYKQIFGRPLRGLWPSEQSVSPETMNLIAEEGIKWVVSDEGILAGSLQKEFHRNFYGNLENPKDLCQAYNYTNESKNVSMIFRNIVYSDLIGFHLGKIDPDRGAWELYDRILDIQQKLVNSTDNHLITIALDGENCWEYYFKDGIPFLEKLYKLLSENDRINVTTVSDYLEENPPSKSIENLHSGSWINRDFHIWIGDPAKNTGWSYLKKAREDLTNFIESEEYSEDEIEKAKEELYIAEGSDWFWWYGDPNVSSQDDLFDEQFRLHLQNIYRILDQPIPAHLFVPVEVFLGRSLKYPSSEFTPEIDGSSDKQDEWRQAGCIEMSPGAMYQSDKIIRRIWFGYDKENIYIRLDTTRPINKSNYEVYIYAYNPGIPRSTNNIRLRVTTRNLPITFRYKYAYEICLTTKDSHLVTSISEAVEEGLWEIRPENNIKAAIGSVTELAIPFKELHVEQGKEIHFTVAIGKSGVLQEIAPENNVVSIKRT
ncbi:MAG: glycoside hydrolase [Vampirovibrionia bacterium]